MHIFSAIMKTRITKVLRENNVHNLFDFGAGRVDHWWLTSCPSQIKNVSALKWIVIFGGGVRLYVTLQKYKKIIWGKGL